jgi:hypothetical protein
MGPINLVACLSIVVCLKYTVSMIVFGRETEAGPTGYSTGLRGGVVSTFSQEQ